MKTFELKVLTCDRTFYDGPCEKLLFPATDGQMEILADHEQMTASIEIGEMKFKTPDSDEWQVAVVSKGLVEVDRNQVLLIAFSAERPEEIDEFRAQEVLERAQEKLINQKSIVEYHVNQANLARALARLKTAGKYKAK